jgi:hypothetical protein
VNVLVCANLQQFPVLLLRHPPFGKYFLNPEEFV